MRLLILILCATVSWGITSNGTGGGTWSVGASWVGGVAPTGADVAVIAAGDTITYDANLTHTAAITVNGTLQGSGTRLLSLNNVALTVNPGGAITNTGGVFTIQSGTANSQNSAQVNLLGTSVSGVTVTGESAANYIRFSDGGFIGGGKITAQYATFDYMGTAGANTTFISAFQFYPSGAFTWEWTNCNFGVNMGRLQNTSNTSATAIVKIEDNIFLATGMNISASLFGIAMTSGGTRSIQRNWAAGSFGSGANGGSWYDATIKHNVVRNRIHSTLSATIIPAAYEWNVIQNKDINPLTQTKDTTVSTPNYLHIHSASGTMDNTRGIQGQTARSQTLQGWIIEPGDTLTNGDIFLSGSPASPFTTTVEYNLLLPNKDGAHTGQFASMLGTASVTMAFQHNTYFPTGNGVESGAITYGETYAGHAGIVGAIKSNLVYGDGDGLLFGRRNQCTVSDGASAANITHNGKYGLLGTGYADQTGLCTTQPLFSTGSPGANDVTADPRFADSTRRMSTWALARGYTASSDYNTAVEAAYEALKTNTAARIVDLITWVRAGYVPQNPAMWQSAHDGGTIGAVSADSLRMSIAAGAIF